MRRQVIEKPTDGVTATICLALYFQAFGWYDPTHIASLYHSLSGHSRALNLPVDQITDSVRKKAERGPNIMEREGMRLRGFSGWVKWVVLVASLTAIFFAGADFVKGMHAGWVHLASASAATAEPQK
jgi:hypothetical protein